MEDITKEYIEKFLDEFIKIEYRGHDHVLARAHYRDVFNELIPRYFVIKENGLDGQTKNIDEGDNK
ncbi:MAG: hypothetical protein ACM3QX_17760 [Syntrophomonadaceae bacterium]